LKLIEPHWLIVYGGGIGSGNNNDKSDGDGRVGGDDCYSESVYSVLDSLPDLYSEFNVFSL